MTVSFQLSGSGARRGHYCLTCAKSGSVVWPWLFFISTTPVEAQAATSPNAFAYFSRIIGGLTARWLVWGLPWPLGLFRRM